MIKLEKTEVMGWEAAIRGMRNPMNSWEKSDSQMSAIAIDEGWSWIGPNDHDLMMRLAKGGPVHAKYRRQIFVSVDITAPLYWWKEFDTYKIGTTANSCSTMHKIHAKEFTLEDFSCEHLLDGSINLLKNIIEELNNWRRWYNRYDTLSEDNKGFTNGTITCKKDIWYQMIQLLPSSYNQKRTVTMTYENLYNMYHSRKDHKLDEWRVGFCNWVKELPYSEIITLEEKKTNDVTV